MEGLPLALDQASAYIEEAACSLADYIALYQTRRTDLLTYRGALMLNHPDSVSHTLMLSFSKLEQSNPAATDLLRLCTFLHPDAIPEELFTLSASELSPLLQPLATDPIALNLVIGDLLKYSLVQRNPETKTLKVHRLTQVSLRDAMSEDTQRAWAERTVRDSIVSFPTLAFKRETSASVACLMLKCVQDLSSTGAFTSPKPSNS